MKAIWWKREFIMFQGWQPWYIRREVEIITETESAYKITYKNWCNRPIEEWQPKETLGSKFEMVKGASEKLSN